MLDDESDESCFFSQRFVFLWHSLVFYFLYSLSSTKSDSLLLIYLLHFLSLEESDSLGDESENDGCEPGSAGTCTFPFCFYDSIGRVSGVGSVVFFPIGVDSNFDVVPLVEFIPIGVESKGSRLINIFWRPMS